MPKRNYVEVNRFYNSKISKLSSIEVNRNVINSSVVIVFDSPEVLDIQLHKCKNSDNEFLPISCYYDIKTKGFAGVVHAEGLYLVSKFRHKFTYKFMEFKISHLN